MLLSSEQHKQCSTQIMLGVVQEQAGSILDRLQVGWVAALEEPRSVVQPP